MMNITEVSSEKFDEVWPIFRQVVQEMDTYPYPPDISKEDAMLHWFSSGAHVFNGYIGDQCIASRYIVPNKIGLGSHICNMGQIVDVTCRGQGIGRQMMEFGIKKATELGFRAIQLNLVVSTNKASIKICEEYGFDIVGTLPEAFFYKREKYVDAFVMYKKLV